jgi:DNA-binding NarL/FixJ family response regulator
VLTQTAAGAIVTAGAGDPSLTRFLDRGPAAADRPAVVEHPAAPPEPRAAAGRPGPGEGPATALTVRETEVLTMVALGLGDREIARRLVLSPKTVEKHVGSAIRKTGSASRTGAAVHGRELGWI